MSLADHLISIYKTCSLPLIEIARKVDKKLDKKRQKRDERSRELTHFQFFLTGKGSIFSIRFHLTNAVLD